MKPPLKKDPAQIELPFPSDQTISVRRATKIIGCHTNTIYLLIERGFLLAYRLHPQARYRISYDSLVQYMDYLRREYPAGRQFGTGDFAGVEEKPSPTSTASQRFRAT